MINKLDVKQVAKQHHVNLKTSGAMALLFSIINSLYPTSDRTEKLRRIDLIHDVMATA